MSTLSPAHAAGWERGQLQLVDVREAAELAEVRVAGARHIPLASLPGGGA